MARPKIESLFDNRRHLALLVAIDHHRSIHAASVDLGISQVALSRTLSRLEQVADVKLFERHRRGVRPTIFGTFVIERARWLLREMEAADKGLAKLRELLEEAGSQGW